MINYYFNESEGKITAIDSFRKGCWIEAVDPDEDEIILIEEKYHVNPDFMSAALDQQETAHIEQEKEQTMVIIDCCRKADSDHESIPQFETYPLTLLFSDEWMITFAPSCSQFLDELRKDEDHSLRTDQPVDFLMTLMKNVALRFQEYLRSISSVSDEVEEQLYRNMSNSHLEDLMKLDKSLIFFSSSLQADQNLLEKIQENGMFDLNSAEDKRLEYNIIEYRQASKMCELYISVNDKISASCSNILSNNMNIVVKRLTVITIVLSIPAMVFGFYGMNIKSLELQHAWIPILIAIAGSALCWLYLKKSRKL